MFDIVSYHNDAGAPLTSTVRSGDDLIFTHADGQVTRLPFVKNGVPLQLDYDVFDQPVVARWTKPDVRMLDIGAVADAMRCYDIATDGLIENTVDDVLVCGLEFVGGAILLTESTGHADMLPLVQDGLTLRAFWSNEAFAGFAHSDDPLGIIVDQAQFDRVVARREIIASRLRGDWEISRDGGIDLDFTVGDSVKMTFSLVNPPSAGTRSESMWVEVTSVDGDEATGFLVSDPTIIGASEGEVVTFPFDAVLAKITSQLAGA